jgi:predicted transcriptional regulator YdeE
MKLKQLLFASTFLFGFAIASLAQMTTISTDKDDVLFVICAEISTLDEPEQQLELINSERFTFFSFENEEGLENKVMKVKMKAHKNIQDLDPDAIKKINVYKKKEDLRKYKADNVSGLIEIYLKTDIDFWHLITQ